MPRHNASHGKANPMVPQFSGIDNPRIGISARPIYGIARKGPKMSETEWAAIVAANGVKAFPIGANR